MKRRLLDYRALIEACVSRYLGREWFISEIKDQAGRSSHPAALISDRRELWRLPFYLAMVEGQGELPRDRLRAVLDQFK